MHYLFFTFLQTTKYLVNIELDLWDDITQSNKFEHKFWQIVRSFIQKPFNVKIAIIA